MRTSRQAPCFASYLIRAQLNREKVDPYFAAFFYGSEIGTGLLVGRATPAADGKYNLNTGTLDSLPLPLPPTLDEQREILPILAAYSGSIVCIAGFRLLVVSRS